MEYKINKIDADGNIHIKVNIAYKGNIKQEVVLDPEKEKLVVSADRKFIEVSGPQILDNSFADNFIDKFIIDSVEECCFYDGSL